MISPERLRQQLKDDPDVEEKVRKHAIERQRMKAGLYNKDTMYDIDEQKKVLQRMIKRGCRSCEQRRQEKWIESLAK